MDPQSYAARKAYRRPANWYRRLNRLGVPLAAMGVAPPGVVTLEVRGRSSGRMRRVPLLRTAYEDHDYLVSLAGESEWVRNVRAAWGDAVIRHVLAHRVHLIEVPPHDRGPIIAEYLRVVRRRSRKASAERQAQSYFGLSAEPSQADIESIVGYYPVFRICYEA
jgi:hypothetical protein